MIEQVNSVYRVDGIGRNGEWQKWYLAGSAQAVFAKLNVDLGPGYGPGQSWGFDDKITSVTLVAEHIKIIEIVEDGRARKL